MSPTTMMFNPEQCLSMGEEEVVEKIKKECARPNIHMRLIPLRTSNLSTLSSITHRHTLETSLARLTHRIILQHHRDTILHRERAAWGDDRPLRYSSQLVQLAAFPLSIIGWMFVWLWYWGRVGWEKSWYWVEGVRRRVRQGMEVEGGVEGWRAEVRSVLRGCGCWGRKRAADTEEGGDGEDGRDGGGNDSGYDSRGIGNKNRANNTTKSTITTTFNPAPHPAPHPAFRSHFPPSEGSMNALSLGELDGIFGWDHFDGLSEDEGEGGDSEDEYAGEDDTEWVTNEVEGRIRMPSLYPLGGDRGRARRRRLRGLNGWVVV